MDVKESQCSIEWCEKKLLARGYCAAHYARSRSGADMQRPFNVYVGKTGDCAVLTCDKPDVHRNLCKTHYSRARKFNLTTEEAATLFSIAACEVCGDTSQTLYVDHDHSCCPEKGVSCGECVRGILCVTCNFGLGSFKDSPDRLKQALSYLERRSQKS